MITVADLKRNANLRGKLFLDLAGGAHHNEFVSETYPRLVVVREQGPREGNKRQPVITTYFVDDVECASLEDVVNRLNAEPLRKEQP